MTQDQLHELADHWGLVCFGPTIAGVWNGCPFSATLRASAVNTFSIFFTCLQTPPDDLLRFSQMELPRGCSVTLQKRRVCMVCSGTDDQMEEIFFHAMEEITQLLQSHAAFPVQCPFCHAAGCDGFAMVDGGYVPVHQSCCYAHSRTAVALEYGRGNGMMGWLGALLGGMAGLIPTIVTAWCWNLVSVWMYLLIPLGACCGYRAFHGRMDGMAKAAVMISSLLQAFVMEQAMFYISIVRCWNVWPSVFASAAHYFEIVEPAEMLRDLYFPVVVILIGVVCVFGMINRAGRKQPLDGSALLESFTGCGGIPIR